ncbi:MAG: DUF429 domain-containing protein [Rhizobiaceae bacterium]
MKTLCGVDGCKGGWVATWQSASGGDPQAAVFADFASLVLNLPPDAIIAVDMPIGLPDFVKGGGRGPEKAVRPLLKQRQSSVFSVPSRAAVYAQCEPLSGMEQMIAAHKRASAIALATSDPPRKISIQAFNLFPKIREIDIFLRANPKAQSRIFESHPEFAFTILNGGEPMALPKKTKGKANPDGIAERREFLASKGFDPDFLCQPVPRGAHADDFLDACVMMLIAGRFANGEARPYPGRLTYDSFNLPIAIHA